MKTIKIKSAGITSTDQTITLPDEIQISDTGEATACHAESGDQSYPSLADLCEAYGLDLEVL